MNTTQHIRNIAIIAHVDHGKTTLLDQLLRQSGQFRKGEFDQELIMDSNPIERERGITILSKNCAINYVDEAGEDFHINIVDTPGHADFSGEVERVLRLADGVLLVVDSFEGVMPQTRYVLSKALEAKLMPVVVINKMDRPDAQPEKVLNEVFDLLVDLGADDHALDFPVVYGSARDGWATTEPVLKPDGDIRPVFEAIIKHIPAPQFDSNAPLQALITTLDYSEYVGRIGIGRVFAGCLEVGKNVAVMNREGEISRQRVSQLFEFDGLGRKETKKIFAGDLFAVVGLETFDIGDTIADLENPKQLPPVAIDQPTIQMTFRVNDGPFSGREGKFVTSRQIRDRLHKELKSNVALRIEERGEEFVVSGRGILHLGILLENMRREGYELTVGKAEVIFTQSEDGKKQEPIELLLVEVPNEKAGTVIQLLGERRSEMLHMDTGETQTRLEFKVPSRALIGLRSKLLTATQGEGIMNHRFLEYGPFSNEIPGRASGVLIATEKGQATGYALELLADRGIMFVKPGDEVYEGQIVGEHNKDNDLPVHIARQKKLNNIRSATKESTTTLKAPMTLDLETALEYIESDELVELTPNTIRLRKRYLRESDRRKNARASAGS